MLDAFIIDRIKREKEERDEEQQPVRLPLEHYPEGGDGSKHQKPEDVKEHQSALRL